MGNEYARAKDVAGEKRMAFTSLADSPFDVCFENILYSCMETRAVGIAISNAIPYSYCCATAYKEGRAGC